MRRFFFTILSVAALTPALAADRPPAGAINFAAEIRQLDGSAIPVEPCEPAVKGKPCVMLTLGKVSEDSLIAQVPGDQPTPDEKNRRFWLAMKVHAGKEPLGVDEIALLKKVIGIAYGPLVLGRAFELLDPASVPK